MATRSSSARGTTANKGRASVAPGTPPVADRRPELRVEPTGNTDQGPRFRAVVAIGPADELDVSAALTGPLAHALWQLRGGVDISNWVDAERLLDTLLARAGSNAEVPLDVVIPKKRARATR